MAKHTMVPSVYVIMEREKRVLLFRRRDNQLLTMPNTEIQDGETLNAAATRAVVTDTLGPATYAKVGVITPVHVMRRYSKTEDRLDFFVEAMFWKHSIRLGDPEKYSELVWIDVDDLPNDCEPHVFDYLRYLLPSPRLYSEVGLGKDRVRKKYTNVTWF